MVACFATEPPHAKEVIGLSFVRHRWPEIVNADHGSQFKAADITDVLFKRAEPLLLDLGSNQRPADYRLSRDTAHQQVGA